MTQRTIALILAAAVILAVAACGKKDDATTGTDTEEYGLFTQQPVGLAITVSNAPARNGGVRSLAQRARLEITAATLHLESVSFYLPATMDCEQYIGIANETVVLQPTTDAVTGPVTTDTGFGLAPGGLRANYTTDDNAEPDSSGSLQGDERIAACVDGDLVFAGPFQVDLTNGTSVPPMQNLGLPAGSYSNIRMQIAPGGRDAGSMQGIALLAHGQYSDTATSFAVTMAVELDEEISIRPDDVIQIGSSGGERILVKFDTDTWQQNLDLPGCYSDEVSAPLGMRIDDSDMAVDCRNIRKKISHNIADSLQALEEEPQAADSE